MRISDWSSDVCSSDLLPRPLSGKVQRERGLADTALLIEERDDHERRSSRVREPSERSSLSEELLDLSPAPRVSTTSLDSVLESLESYFLLEGQGFNGDASVLSPDRPALAVPLGISSEVPIRRYWRGTLSNGRRPTSVPPGPLKRRVAATPT